MRTSHLNAPFKNCHLKKSIKYLLSNILILSSCFCFSQTSNIDSLVNLLKTDKEDTTKLFHLYTICDEYETNGKYQEGLVFGNKAIAFADVLYHKSDEEEVKQFIQKYKSFTYNNIGMIHVELGNYAEAIKNHFASLKIKEFLKDKKGVSGCYNNIGNVYFEQRNYSLALTNYYSSLKIKEEMGDKKGMSNSYSNIGNICYEQKNYTEAFNNYSKALVLRKEINDSIKIASSYNDIAGIYFAKEDYTNALKMAILSLNIKEKAGNRARVANDYGNIGNILQSQKKYKEARSYYSKGIKISKELGLKNYLKSAFKSLSDLDSTIGDFKGAYENHKNYILYRDSLDNEETRKKTIQSQMTFDFEKKEAIANAEHKKELENQEVLAAEKSRKQKTVIVFVVFGLLSVLVFAAFVFRSLRITRKQKHIIELQKNLVEQQKQEVELQKNIVEEHQKEIIDSIKYARRIQRSLLPTETYIEKALNRLLKK